VSPVTPESLDRLVAMLAGARPACGAVTVVALDGPSGSGKTTLAGALAARTGAPVLHMDDIYPGWDGLAVAVGLVTTEVLDPLARGEHAAYRRWKWDEERWGATVPVPTAATLILEGAGSSVLPAGHRVAVSVWVDAARDVRLARGIARDGESYRPHWERWAAQEDALFAADGTRARADLVIETSAM